MNNIQWNKFFYHLSGPLNSWSKHKWKAHFSLDVISYFVYRSRVNESHSSTIGHGTQIYTRLVHLSRNFLKKKHESFWKKVELPEGERNISERFFLLVFFTSSFSSSSSSFSMLLFQWNWTRFLDPVLKKPTTHQTPSIPPNDLTYKRTSRWQAREIV